MEVFEVLSLRSNEHISHEESVVGTSADDSNLDPILFVPSCKAVYNVDTISGVQVINGTFSVDSPDL